MQEENIDINSIIEDKDLKPYFLDLVAKNFSKTLYESYHHRYLPKIKAQKDFYDSLYLLSEKLKFIVPDDYIQATIIEVSKHYMQSLSPIMRKGKFSN